MKTKYNGLFIALVFLTSSFFIACKKDTASSSFSDDKQLVADDLLVETTFEDIQTIGDQSITVSALKSHDENDSSALPDADNIMFDTMSSVKQVKLDFKQGKKCGDARFRKGVIKMDVANGYFLDKGAIITYSLDSYEVDSNKVTGTRVVTNEGFVTGDAMYPDGYYRYKVVVHATITKPDGTIIKWYSTKLRKLILGFKTKTWKDNVFAISGTASGSCSKNGTQLCSWVRNSNIDIVRPLIYKYAICGKVTIQKTNQVSQTIKKIVIDYGTTNWRTWKNYAPTKTRHITIAEGESIETTTVDEP